jgi:CRP-like cAMP-binding protein
MSRRNEDWIMQLGDVALFLGCTRAQLRKIASLTTEIDVPAGAVLCREGHRGDEFFVVLEGSARVTMAGQPVNSIGPGGFFGELALLDNGPRTATVTADSEMRLLVLSRQEFVVLLADVHIVTRRLMRTMAARFRSLMTGARPSLVGAV